MEKIQEIFKSNIEINAGVYFLIIAIAVIGIIYSTFTLRRWVIFKNSNAYLAKELDNIKKNLDKASEDNTILLDANSVLKNQVRKKEALIIDVKERLEALKKDTAQPVAKPTARVRKPKAE